MQAVPAQQPVLASQQSARLGRYSGGGAASAQGNRYNDAYLHLVISTAAAAAAAAAGALAILKPARIRATVHSGQCASKRDGAAAGRSLPVPLAEAQRVDHAGAVLEGGSGVAVHLPF